MTPGREAGGLRIHYSRRETPHISVMGVRLIVRWAEDPRGQGLCLPGQIRHSGGQSPVSSSRLAPQARTCVSSNLLPGFRSVGNFQGQQGGRDFFTRLVTPGGKGHISLVDRGIPPRAGRVAFRQIDASPA